MPEPQQGALSAPDHTKVRAWRAVRVVRAEPPGRAVRAVRRFARAGAVVGAATFLAAGLGACSPAASDPPEATPTTATITPEASPSPAPEPLEPEPSDSPASPPDPPPEPSPDPDDRSHLLVQPEAMQKVNRAGAVAAAKYYMGLFEYVYLTGDLTMWDEMTRPECNFCTGVSADVTAMHDAGQYIISGPPEWLGEAKAEKIVTSARWHVTLRARVAPAKTLDARGMVIEEHEEARSRVTIAVEHLQDMWQVIAVEISDDH